MRSRLRNGSQRVNAIITQRTKNDAEEIQDAIEQTVGRRPNRSEVLRIAVSFTSDMIRANTEELRHHLETIRQQEVVTRPWQKSST